MPKERSPRAGVSTIDAWRRRSAKVLPCKYALPEDPHTFRQLNARHTECCQRVECRARMARLQNARMCEKRKKKQKADITWDPTDPLDWLLRSGWGSVERARIPADVLAAAEALRMPRENPRRRRNDAL